MMFWVLAAILTAVVTIVLLLPLARAGRSADISADHDIEVYSDQLAELDRDAAAGLISGVEAESAKAEIGRRLLRASREKAKADDGRRSVAWHTVARVAIVAGVPAAALGGYLLIGSPDLPGQPLAARQASQPGPNGVEALVAKAEAHLAENPDDGRGWEVLAPIYLRMGRLEEARTAYSNAIRLLGPSAERQSGYGQTLVALAGGVVTDEARVAFQSARELEPTDPKAAFFLAMALVQEGRDERALEAFRNLAAISPADAPWMDAVNAHIAALDNVPAPLALSDEPAEDALPEDGIAPGNPDAAAIAAARNLSEGDRQAMIDGMVEGLDGRLRENPDNIEGWIRLVRSYGVLGRSEEAQDALRRGLEVFPADSHDGQALLAVARKVGVDAPDEDVSE